MQLEDTRPTHVESAVPIIAAKDVWEEAETSDSYRSPATSHGYASALELSLRQPQPLKEQSAHLIDLESDAIEQEAGESLLHVSSNELTQTNGPLHYALTQTKAIVGCFHPLSSTTKCHNINHKSIPTNSIKQPELLFLEKHI